MKQTWEELREKFFKECVEEVEIWSNQEPKKLPRVWLPPTDLFEWFKKELAGTTEPSLRLVKASDRLPNGDGVYHSEYLGEKCLMKIQDGEFKYLAFSDGGRFSSEKKNNCEWLEEPSLPIKEVEDVTIIDKLSDVLAAYDINKTQGVETNKYDFPNLFKSKKEKAAKWIVDYDVVTESKLK